MTSYRCPFCDHYQTTTPAKYDRYLRKIAVTGNAEGDLGTDILAITCANPNCKRTTVRLSIHQVRTDIHGRPQTILNGKVHFARRVLPEGAARLFPDYIPEAILEDYREACLIRDLSPKAAATLVRRCLQGMIRDFCGIKRNRLVDEIAELKRSLENDEAPKGVSIESIEAIDHVRGIGNIGAHMEKDVALVIPVEPEEATLLIELVETLFDEWYIASHKRRERLEKIRGAAKNKEALKKLPKPSGEEKQ